MLDFRRLNRLRREAEVALKVIEDATSRPLNLFLNDFKIVFAVRYAIVQVVEACTLMGIHILEEVFNEAPEAYKDVFRELARLNVIDENTANNMIKLVGLRNLVVHRYWEIDDSLIYKNARESGIGSIKTFIDEVIKYAAKHKG